MKHQLLSILFVSFLWSCTSNEDDAHMQELAPVLSVNIPGSFEAEQSYEMEIIYKRPTNCHTYRGLDISQEENEITVGVVTSFPPNQPNCMEMGNLQASTRINFVAERDDFYIFKFWKGRSATGTDEFLIAEVPVTQPGEE